jgi:hypothetical protein
VVVVDGCNFVNSNNHGVVVFAGNASIGNSSFQVVTNGITAFDGTSQLLDTGGNSFTHVTTPWYMNASTTRVMLNSRTIITDPQGGTTSLTNTQGNLFAPTLASADPLYLPSLGDQFIISGTTGFGTLRDGWCGRQVTFVFQGVLTIYVGIANSDNMRLSGNANMITTAGGTLTLRHNGNQWYEVGRST